MLFSPVRTYTGAGVYTVTLSVSGGVVTDTLTRTNYITATGGTVYTTTTHVITYTYDKLYRLTDADYSSGEAFAYGYDPVGNRTVHTRTLTSTTVITYAYDAANRLDYFYEDGALTDLGWDANGNLRAQGTSVYTWDAANRLVAAEVDGVASAYEYDGLGNRVAQTVGGVTTEYVLDVGGGLPEVIAATTGGASTRYVQVQGQVLAQQDSGAWMHILPDHLGSVRQLVGSDSRVDLAQSFDPFGVPFETSGSGVSDFGYTGEWWDSEAGVLYLRARYYDPYGGVFVQKDSFLGIPLSPSTMNGFNYANQNPVNLTDRSGHSPHGGDPIALCLELPACRILLGMGGSVVGVTSSPVLVMLAVPTGLLAITYFYCGPTGCAPDPVIPPGPVPEPPAPAPPLHPPLPGVTPMPPFPDTTGTGEDPFSLPPIYQRAPEPEPEPTPPPFPIPVRRPTPPPTCTSTPEPKWHLYHYTDNAGLAGILATQQIWPSIRKPEDPKSDAQWGDGQYFTDLSPQDASRGSAHQLSRALYNTPWRYNRVKNWVKVNVAGLPVKRVAPVFSRTYGDRSIYLHLSQSPLDGTGRIDSWGVTPFAR
jgi:RHS repeat-associated protein